MADGLFDYVVIGAGTSGSVVAAKLAESGKHSVAVIEAGPMDTSPWIHIPIGFFKTLQDPRINWGYQARFDDGNNPRAVNWPRGKVVGGSGSINGLVYIQGQREDYADWGRELGPDWDWPAVASRFDELRASGMVSGPGWRHRLVDAFVEAAGKLGYPENNGFNGESQEGAGYFELNTRRGWRASTARRFLHPAMKAGRIELITGAHVQKIALSEGRAAAAVIVRDGEAGFIGARREIILAAGSIGSPQILQMSGLGPARVLRKAGVEVVRDISGVGRNLRDHYAVRTMYRIKGARTLNEMSHSQVSRTMMGLQFALTRSGPLSIGAGVAGLFTSVVEPGGRPDVQFIMGPLSTDNPAEGLHRWPGMTLTYTQSHPRSAGYVEIVSPNATDAPHIVANYLSDPHDQEVVVRAMHLARRLAGQAPLSGYIETELAPGSDCRSRDEIISYAMQYGGSVYHPCGSVRMGGDDAPLDAQMRLRGVDGLRVIDASAMPGETSGNINAVCAMIGLAGADFILRS